MTTFIAVYRGQTISDAKIIAVNADPVLVADVVARLLATPEDNSDPVITSIQNGRRAALRQIRKEAANVLSSEKPKKRLSKVA